MDCSQDAALVGEEQTTAGSKEEDEGVEMTSTSEWIEHRLAKELPLRPFLLLGCPRRNVLSGRAWRSDVGAAVCALVGSRATVEWEGSPVDFYMLANGESLLLWRAGPWRNWWIEDATLLVGMVRAQSNIHAIGVFVLHEVDGATHVRYVATPERETSRVYDEMMARWRDTPTPRIKRNSERGKAVCWRCPVRKRCEAIDLEEGATGDWL